MTKPTKAELADAYRQQLDTNELLMESLVELELAREDVGWLKLMGQGEHDFTRDGLANIIHLARLSVRKNPLINHAVEVTSQYVFGQGVSTMYEEEALNDVWQGFWDDPKNKSAFSDHRALLENEQELEVAGNLFFALFSNISTGRVLVRGIPVEEIRDIICNPEDAKEPWFYRRVWGEAQLDLRFTGSARIKQREAFYPDVRYWPAKRPPAMANSDKPIFWDSPVYHTKVGGSAHMKFGVPEVYPALDWAKAVKENLEDFATVSRARAKIIFRMTLKGKKGVAAAKTKLGTTLGASTGSGETNPPTGVASFFLGSEGAGLEPISTKGMTQTPDEGRGLRLMVGAGVGLPDTILSGDADVGNLATAKTLDRPTELKMVSRQMLWTGIYQAIAWYVNLQAVGTPNGPLTGLGNVVANPLDNSRVVVWRGEINDTLKVDWPPILERDTASMVQAIVMAATLDGKPLAELFTRDAVGRMLGSVLGEDNIDEMLQQMDDNMTATEAKFGAVLQDLRQMAEASRNGGA